MGTVLAVEHNPTMDTLLLLETDPNRAVDLFRNRLCRPCCTVCYATVPRLSNFYRDEPPDNNKSNKKKKNTAQVYTDENKGRRAVVVFFYRSCSFFLSFLCTAR